MGEGYAFHLQSPRPRLSRKLWPWRCLVPQELQLIPTPKSITRSPGKFAFPSVLFIILPAPSPPPPFSPSFFGKIHFTVEHFITKAESLTGNHFQITPGPAIQPSAEIRLSLNPSLHLNLPSEIRPQSYRLEILPTGISITAAAPSALFYALQTLLRIIGGIPIARRVGAVQAKIEHQNSKILAPLPHHPRPPRIPSPRRLPRHARDENAHRRYTAAVDR